MGMRERVRRELPASSEEAPDVELAQAARDVEVLENGEVEDSGPALRPKRACREPGDVPVPVVERDDDRSPRQRPSALPVLPHLPQRHRAEAVAVEPSHLRCEVRLAHVQVRERRCGRRIADDVVHEDRNRRAFAAGRSGARVAERTGHDHRRDECDECPSATVESRTPAAGVPCHELKGGIDRREFSIRLSRERDLAARGRAVPATVPRCWAALPGRAVRVVDLGRSLRHRAASQPRAQGKPPGVAGCHLATEIRDCSAGIHLQPTAPRRSRPSRGTCRRRRPSTATASGPAARDNPSCGRQVDR